MQLTAGPVKGNQPTLERCVVEHFTGADVDSTKFGVWQTEDRAHGRHELRRAWVNHDVAAIDNPERWKNLTALVRVESTRTLKSERSVHLGAQGRQGTLSHLRSGQSHLRRRLRLWLFDVFSVTLPVNSEEFLAERSQQGGSAPPHEVGDTAESWLRSAVRAPALDPHALPNPVLLRGSMLGSGRFAIQRKLGEGGGGVVYQALDGQRRSMVAIKLLKLVDPLGIYRLKSEFRALADVAHPNLVALHELFAEDGRWFFSMELVAGERFDRWVRPTGLADAAHALDESRLRSALSQLCEAVAAIHAAGKLHRDLKPSNVLVTAEGRVVVLDFGLAADPEPGGVGQTVQDHSVSGTPAYMAPEQAAGAPATAASDFYALGVMLYEALTGALPFAGSAAQMLIAKQRDIAAAPSQIAPGVPPDLDELCLALLSCKPTRRTDAAALQVALGVPSKPALSSRASVAAPSSAPEASDALLGRHDELAALRQAYAATLSGQSVVLFLSGESGVGKSALVDAFLSELRAEHRAVVLAGRCYERESVPYKAFDALVDELSRYLRKLTPQEAQALMPREVFALARLFPALARVDAVAHSPTKHIADPQELQRRAFAAFGELLGRISDREPLVVYIDDLQWADSDSTVFMVQLLAHREPAPALLIASHRSEGAADNALLQKTLRAAADNTRLDCRELRVGGLSAAASQALVQRLLRGQDAAVRQHVVTIAAESHGSPFFAFELVRQLCQTSTEPTSLTLHDALARHVASLENSARALLEVVAVAGRPLAVQVALDASGAQHGVIDVLLTERLLRVAGSGAGRRLECYHDQIREKVGSALTDAARRDVHARLAAVLTASVEGDPEHLAVHFEGAGEHAIAAQHNIAAGNRAVAKLAFERAAGFFTRALEIGLFAPDRERSLLIARGDALTDAGRGAEAADSYVLAAHGAPGALALDLKRRAAERLLLSGHLDRGRVLIEQVLAELGMPAASTHGLAMAGFLVQRALARVRGLGFRERSASATSADDLSRLEASYSCAQGFAMTDNIRGAIYQTHHLRLALRVGESAHVARAMSLEYGFVGRLGPPTRRRAAALYQRAYALAQRVGSPTIRGYLQMMHATVGICQGNFSEAVAAADEAVHVLREVGLRAAMENATARFMQACGLFFKGDLRRCSELVPALVAEAARRNDVFGVVTLSSGWPSAAWLVRDEPDEASRRLEAAAKLWAPAGYQLQSLYLLIGRSQVSFYRGRGHAACQAIEQQWSAAERSQVLRIPVLKTLLLLLRGHAAALAARDLTGVLGFTPTELQQLANRAASATARTGFPMSPAFGASIRASVACARGDTDGAVRQLQISVSGFDAAGMAMYAAAHRRRLGAWLGGDEGQHLVAEATSAMQAQAVVDPERMTDMLAPGCAR